MAPRRWGRHRNKRVQLDQDALQKLKGSPAVMAEVTKYARTLAKRANASLQSHQSYPDYDVGVTAEGKNPHAAVFTRSNHAKYSNAKHQTLTKLL